MFDIGPLLGPDPGKLRPDFCISTLDDTLAKKEYIEAFEFGLHYHPNDFKILKDSPYQGKGYITEKYGKPNQSFNAIQLEVKQLLDPLENVKQSIHKAVYEVLTELKK